MRGFIALNFTRGRSAPFRYERLGGPGQNRAPTPQSRFFSLPSALMRQVSQPAAAPTIVAASTKIAAKRPAL